MLILDSIIEKKQHQFYYVMLFLYLKKFFFLQKFASICLCCCILSFFSSVFFILISLSKNLSKSSFFEFLDLVLNRNCFCLFSTLLKNKSGSNSFLTLLSKDFDSVFYSIDIYICWVL